MTISHGTILGGLSTVPDLDRAVHAYRDILGLELEETGSLVAEVLSFWCELLSDGQSTLGEHQTSGSKDLPLGQCG